VFEKSLNEAESILRTQKEPLTPVNKVWEEVVKRSKVKGFEVATLPDFTAMLEGDGRFQIIPAKRKSLEDEDIPSEPELEDDEMEQLGFYSEDQVKLREIRVGVTAAGEDDEEVGSIKRKAFVSHENGLKQNGKKQKVKLKKIESHKRRKKISKSTPKKTLKKKKLRHLRGKK
jgi:hypothetical protein